MLEKINIKYPRTNEDLMAIIKGLDLQSTDKVLAVAGSGDQAFAMLPYVSSILSTDTDPNQIDYIKQRIKWLQEGKGDLFLMEDINQKIEFPFLHTRPRDIPYNDKRRQKLLGSRLPKIKETLENLTLVADRAIQDTEFVTDLKEKNINFTKMYMSNVICSFWEEMSKELSEFCMQNLIELLSNQGLIYFSNGDDMERMMTQFKDKLQPEETLTQISREYERKFGFKYCAESAKKPLWIPSVYRKVTN